MGEGQSPLRAGSPLIFYWNKKQAEKEFPIRTTNSLRKLETFTESYENSTYLLDILLLEGQFWIRGSIHNAYNERHF